MSKLAPNFELKINGERLSPGIEANISRIVHEEAFFKSARVDIIIDNGISCNLSLSKIRLRSKLELSLGYGHELVPIFEGKVAIWQPNFSRQKKKDQFRLTALDYSDDMKTLNNPVLYTESNPADIAEQVIRKYQLTPVINPANELRSLKQTRGQSLNQDGITDWELLERIARLVNYKLFCRENSIYIVGESGMKCIPYTAATFVYRPTGSEIADPDIFELIEFTPNVDKARQRTEVVVKSWSAFRDDGEEIGKASLSDIPDGEDGFTELIVEANIMQRLTVHTIARNLGQAQKLAEAELKRRAEDLVKGDMLTKGMPELRIGQTHTLKINAFGDVGESFSGKYLIKSVRNEFDQKGGYVTLCDISKRTMKL